MSSFLNDSMAQGSLKKAIAETGGAEFRGAARFPVDQFVIDPVFNIRSRETARYKAQVQEIKRSILANGFLNEKPLGVIIIETDAGPRPVIHDGHRRYEAAMLAIAEGAPLESLPAVPKPAGTSIVDLTVGLQTQNSDKSGLEPLESAALAKRLIDFGLDEKEIARRFGLDSVATVQNWLVLIGAPAKVQKLVASGKVSATLAVQELKADPKGAAERLVSEAAATPEGKKVKAAKVKAARPAKPPKKATARPAPLYRNVETGETWTGRGMQPKWVQAALASGKVLDDFKAPEVQADDAATAVPDSGFVGTVEGPDQSGAYTLRFASLPPVPLHGKTVRVIVD